jgi:hypothetical protein
LHIGVPLDSPLVGSFVRSFVDCLISKSVVHSASQLHFLLVLFVFICLFNLCCLENRARSSGWWSVFMCIKQICFVCSKFFVKNKYLLDILLHV